MRSVKATTAAAVVYAILSTMMPAAGAAPPVFDDGSGMPQATDGRTYGVTVFKLAYLKPFPFLLNIEQMKRQLGNETIELGVAAGGYAAPQPGLESVQILFGELAQSETEQFFTLGAIRHIAATLTEATSAVDGRSCFVAVSPNDIDPVTGKDLRPGDSSALVYVLSFDGPFYPISAFDLSYEETVAGHPALPTMVEILDATEVELVPTDEGYVTWRPGVAPVILRLSELGEHGSMSCSAGAVQAAMEAIRDTFIDQGYMAVNVSPMRGEIAPDQTLADLRDGRTTFRMQVVMGLVTDVRTLAVGDRVPTEERINNPKHQWIREDSPIQPQVEVEEEPTRRDLLRREALDNYLFRLSRHPGRRVDAAVASAEGPVGISLDYIVTENSPLLIYGHASNTGTEQTDRWRFRTGIYHNQLTGNDDILSVEYVTTDLDRNNAVLGSYEARVFDLQRLRWRGYANWSSYSASEVGRAEEFFEGESWSVGGELIWNFYQDRQFFLDLVGGARWTDHEVKNAFVFVSGQEQFFLPYVGLRLERETEESNTNINLTLEWNMGDVTALNRNEMNRLGRLFPDRDWWVLRWDATHAFYLEPLLNREAWEDVTTPESSTLAHEIALRVRGQHALNYRLIPQSQQVAGGMYSVRGYPESVVVGDNAVIGTAEYRFHLPRALGIEAAEKEFMGEPFRIRPEYPYGRADWDLILRGFVDVGYVEDNEPLSFETEHTLVGVGCGVELQFKRNVNVRLDWGFALEDVEGRVNSGSNRLHFAATIMF